MENPYEPPKPLINDNTSEQPAGIELASRWMRLFASLVDTVLGSGIYLGIVFLILGYDLKSLTTVNLPAQVMMAVLHGYLLAKKGQTIGKLIFKMRIAQLDGSIPPFLPLVAKRYLPIWLVTQIPVIGGFCSLIDACFIFRADKRCVHDLIAGTMVVKVT